MYENIVLETQDLILKKAKQEDWKDMYLNLWCHEESSKYMLWEVTTCEEDAIERMKRTIEFEKKEKYTFLVYEKETQKAIGFAGMKEVEPGIFEDMGVALGPEFCKKGYGKQILNALVNEAFKQSGVNKFLASCRINNLASHKLQMACGFRYSHSESKIDPRNGESYILEYNERNKEQ